MFSLKGKKSSTATPGSKTQSGKESVQTWLPIADIKNNYALRKDGTLVGFLRIYPIDLSLMSEKEKRRIVQALKEAINAETRFFEIFSIQRPVDLETYLSALNTMVSTVGNPMRRVIIRDSIEYAVRMVATGSCVERQFYVILTQPKGKNAEQDLMEHMREFMNKLGSASLHIEICSDMDIITLCALYATPQSTAAMPKSQELSNFTVLDDDTEGDK